MLLACAFSLATWHSLNHSQELVDAGRLQLGEASRYLVEHPHLESGRVLRARFNASQDEKLVQGFERARAERGDSRVPDVELRSQQKQLDGLVETAAQLLEELPSRRLGVNPTLFRPETWFTYVLLHSSYFHLGGCLALFLWLAAYLEPSFGVARFACMMAVGTVSAALGYVIAMPELDRVLLGSSGLLFGVWLVFLWKFAALSKSWFYPVTAFGGAVWLSAPWLTGLGGPFDHPGSDMMHVGLPSIALLWVYAGGAAGTLTTVSLMSRLGTALEPRSPRPHETEPSTGSAELDRARAASDDGRDEDAYLILMALVRSEPDSVEGATLLADVATRLGKTDDAVKAQLRVVEVQAKRGDGSRAVRPWLGLTQREIPTAVEPALLVRMASLLLQAEKPSAAAEALRAALDRASGASSMVVAGRVARAAKEIDPELSHDAAWRALSFADLPFSERQELETLLGHVLPRLASAKSEIPNAWEQAAVEAPATEVATALRPLDVVHAIPADLDDEGFHISTKGGQKKRIRFDRIQAVSAVGVRGLGPRPVLLIDLILNWDAPQHECLRVVRVRGDKFDPRQFVHAENAVEAFRKVVMTLLERAEARPLPERDAVLGRPYTMFDSVARYESDVLFAEAPLSENLS